MPEHPDVFHCGAPAPACEDPRGTPGWQCAELLADRVEELRQVPETDVVTRAVIELAHEAAWWAVHDREAERALARGRRSAAPVRRDRRPACRNPRPRGRRSRSSRAGPSEPSGEPEPALGRRASRWGAS